MSDFADFYDKCLNCMPLKAKLKTARADVRLWKLRTKEAADTVRDFERLQAELDQYRWIPVSEKPKNNVEVYICDEKTGWCCVGRYNTFGMKRWRCHDAIVFPTVTHWMPIILPKGE